jgi:hypothetical protein
MPIYTFLHPLYPIRLLKVDNEGELVRDANGFCVQCKPGDTGEVVKTKTLKIFISNSVNKITVFTGWHNPQR